MKYLIEIEEVLDDQTKVSYSPIDKKYTVVFNGDAVTFDETLIDQMCENPNVSPGTLISDALKMLETNAGEKTELEREYEE